MLQSQLLSVPGLEASLVPQQPSLGDSAAEKGDIKSCEVLPLERSGLKAPSLFQPFPLSQQHYG